MGWVTQTPWQGEIPLRLRKREEESDASGAHAASADTGPAQQRAWLAVCGASEAVAFDTAIFGVVERTGVERTPS